MEGNLNLKVAILIRGNKVSGAERRAINIACELSKRCDVYVELWLDGNLNDAIRDFAIPDNLPVVNYGFGAATSRFFNRGRRQFFEVRNAFGFNLLERKIRSTKIRRLCRDREIDLLHVFLDNGIDEISGVSVFREVTSREEAEIVSNFPAHLRKAFYFNAVSATVLSMLSDDESAGRRGTIGLPLHLKRDFSGDSSNKCKENLIVWGHRMIERKNGVLFAQAVKEFLNLRPDWKVEILGSGPDEVNIRTILEDVIDPSRVTIGYSKNLPEHLERSAIFVSLIEPDNYPSQSVFEAMTMKNALLLSNTGSSEEMFLEGNGVLCDLTKESVLDSLMKLTDSVKDLEEMGENSKRVVEERYDSDIYMERLVSAYNTTLGSLTER